jgi:hypothetical protein
MVKLTGHESLSGETVRRRLAENGLKSWRKDILCIPRVDGEYVARIEEVLDMPKRPIPGGRWSVSTRAGPADRRGAPADPRRAGSAPTLRLRVSPQRHRQSLRLHRCASALAQGQGHRAAGGRRQRPMHCASLSMSIILMARASGSYRTTTCRPTRLAPSMRHSRSPKSGEFCDAWNSITPPSMPAGSTWSRSRSACSAVNVWIAESTTQNTSSAKSPLGSNNETSKVPASNGYSQPTRPAPKRAAPIP